MKRIWLRKVGLKFGKLSKFYPFNIHLVQKLKILKHNRFAKFQQNIAKNCDSADIDLKHIY